MKYNMCSANATLWTRSMRSLGYAQFLLYAALYMWLPVLPWWMAREWECGYAGAGWITALFAPAMWIPGLFHSYLIDAFPRKSVGMWGAFVLAVSFLLMGVASSLVQVALLRVVQGMAFGVATMAIGSTLVIDVAPSDRRTAANTAFVWIARLGMAAGMAVGLYLFAYDGLEAVRMVSAAAGWVAMLCLPVVSVPFRAPLHAPLLTLDRFFLPRAWLPMCVAFPVMVVAGMLVVRVCHVWLYGVMGIGVVAGWLSMGGLLHRAPSRAAVELGQASTVGGLLLLIAADSLVAQCVAAFLVAWGIGLTASRLFGILIGMAQHCERGSANNSYQLLWELGLMGGLAVAASMDGAPAEVFYGLCVALSVMALVAYEVKFARYND